MIEVHLSSNNLFYSGVVIDIGEDYIEIFPDLTVKEAVISNNQLYMDGFLCNSPDLSILKECITNKKPNNEIILTKKEIEEDLINFIKFNFPSYFDLFSFTDLEFLSCFKKKFSYFLICSSRNLFKNIYKIIESLEINNLLKFSIEPSAKYLSSDIYTRIFMILLDYDYREIDEENLYYFVELLRMNSERGDYIYFIPKILHFINKNASVQLFLLDITLTYNYKIKEILNTNKELILSILKEDGDFEFQRFKTIFIKNISKYGIIIE